MSTVFIISEFISTGLFCLELGELPELIIYSLLAIKRSLTRSSKANYQFLAEQYKYGLRSCFHRKTEDIAIKLTMGVVVHILCGYVTLPLYALVTQVNNN